MGKEMLHEVVRLGKIATANSEVLETMIDWLDIPEERANLMKHRIGYMESLCLRIGYLRGSDPEGLEQPKVSPSFDDYMIQWAKDSAQFDRPMM